jgi:hypothetical protein
LAATVCYRIIIASKLAQPDIIIIGDPDWILIGN